MFTDGFEPAYGALETIADTEIMMDHNSEFEDASCDENEMNEVEIVLRISPLLSFISGSAPGNYDANKKKHEPHRSVNLEKVVRRGHNGKKTNTLKKQNAICDFEKAENAKLIDVSSDSHSNRRRVNSRENSPKQRRRHKLGLMRSLSSNSDAPKEIPYSTRRLSDPTLSSQENRMKGSFERRESLKKLLKRTAASPFHLFGKVASFAGSKHNQDINHSKDPKENKKAGTPKRLYPSLSKALEPPLGIMARRGSDPGGIHSRGAYDALGDTYEKDVNDFSSQIRGLEVSLRNLSTSTSVTLRRECHENYWGNETPSCNPSGEMNTEDERSLKEVFKQADVNLKEILEQVLKSHILRMDNYSSANCDRVGRSISEIITRLLGGAKNTTDSQRKIACLVYIGAIRDDGIHMSTQALWCPEEDTFAAASFRNKSVYGIAVVIVVPA